MSLFFPGLDARGFHIYFLTATGWDLSWDLGWDSDFFILSLPTQNKVIDLVIDFDVQFCKKSPQMIIKKAINVKQNLAKL